MIASERNKLQFLPKSEKLTNPKLIRIGQKKRSVSSVVVHWDARGALEWVNSHYRSGLGITKI